MQTQVFNIVLPKDLVREADRVAKQEYKNRSELIREALRLYIEDKQMWGDIFRASEKAMKQMGITSEKDVERLVSEYRHGRKAR